MSDGDGIDLHKWIGKFREPSKGFCFLGIHMLNIYRTREQLQLYVHRSRDGNQCQGS